MPDIELKIFRIDLSLSPKSYYQTVTTSYETNETLLEVLQRYRDEKDPSLSYEKNCRLGLCFSCKMKINGRPALACQTNINTIANEPNSPILIEPIKVEHAVKDLITDPDLAKAFNEDNEIL